MADNLFVEERRRLILDLLRQQGRVSVKTLSDSMQVSTVTIRQDLRALEESGYLERTYGGAVRRDDGGSPMPELSFHARVHKKRRDKDAIAAAAIRRVQEGYSVALDASSTTYTMVPALKSFRKLTVITNSLIIAQSFLDAPHVQVFIPGGRLRRDSISIVGRPEGLPELNINIGFFGARGVSAANGITDVDADEVTLKQAMMKRCVHSIVLVDGSKWGQVAPYTLARLADVHGIITSDDAPGDWVSDVRDAGMPVEVVTVHNR
jgi:DeoR family fructose operon transcriptional repressor